jgi:hypothetical protein
MALSQTWGQLAACRYVKHDDFHDRSAADVC